MARQLAPFGALEPTDLAGPWLSIDEIPFSLDFALSLNVILDVVTLVLDVLLGI